jgi:hypothetical protein
MSGPVGAPRRVGMSRLIRSIAMSGIVSLSRDPESLGVDSDPHNAAAAARSDSRYFNDMRVDAVLSLRLW